MISVCYLSPSRRRRARSRWCWAPAPGGCWMWLGREQKTTKTTVWCTAKVSKQRRHPVISPQRNTPRHSSHRRKDTDNPPSTPLLPVFLSVSLAVFSFTFPFFLSCSPCVSKSQTQTNNCMYAATRTQNNKYMHTHTPSPYLFFCKESFISLKLWLGTEKHHLTPKVNGL